MPRLPLPALAFAALGLALTAIACAHFVFVVPDPDGDSARVMLSEKLEPDPKIPATLVAPTKLAAVDATGRRTPLVLTPGDGAMNGAMVVPIPPDTRRLEGLTDLGVVQRGDTKPGVLIYHSTTLIGDPFAPAPTAATASQPAGPSVQLMLVGRPGAFHFELRIDGKPRPNDEVDVQKPDGTEDRYPTDAAGRTEAFAAPGRYAAWARHVLTTPGERGGKHFDEVRHYATLVFTVPTTTTPPASAPATAVWPALPQRISSFGAVAAGGWLYVYGGHAADTHDYSMATISGQFHRLSLSDPQTWQTLPAGPLLQGMNLATWRGKVIRVGGMTPHNDAGAKADVYSVADVAYYDPATGQWSPLPSLPQPRSSHDVAILGDTLYVLGGWTLAGDMMDADFRPDMLSLDLTATSPKWKAIEQPFKRRALIAAAHAGKLYAIGGFDEEAEPSRSVDVYDPATGTWSRGPGLPGPDLNGFGPAACEAGGKLYASVGDGSLLVLNDAFNTWDKVASTTPRIVHRMVPAGDSVLILGGAQGAKQTDRIEAVRVGEPPTTRPAR